jgi:hypothetical protein
MPQRGVVNSLLEELFKKKKLEGEFAKQKRNLLKIQLSLKTGLSINKFTPNSFDSEDEINKISEVLKNQFQMQI